MRHRVKHLFVSLPLLIIGLLGIGFVLLSIYKEHNRTKEIDLEIAKKQEIAAEIEKENDILKKTISYLESEDAQKFSARKLGYQEADQNVASVKDIASAKQDIENQVLAEAEREADNQDLQADVPNWEMWWNVFF